MIYKISIRFYNQKKMQGRSIVYPLNTMEPWINKLTKNSTSKN